MVEKFKLITTLLEKKYAKDLSLFIVMRMDDLTEKWSVFVAADWINNENKRDIFVSIYEGIRANFSDQEAQLIARIGVFSLDDYTPQLFVNYKEGSEILNQKINGYFIHEAHVLRNTVSLTANSQST